MMAAYIERHHAFLRGALDWKSSHRTYMILTGTMARAHVEALKRMPDRLPPRPGIEALARGLTGGELVHADHWLVATEEAARAGEELDATESLEVMLATAPSWYVGLGPDEPIPAAEPLASARTYGEDAPDQH
ncbi:hypothetical protein [Brachybacterium sp. GPGPB12]|uniref:hypothetical protein n=1 Tax=Brachybacterium sp. GPGPB12 TaxID=3023517 RepID=UPI00313458EB